MRLFQLRCIHLAPTEVKCHIICINDLTCTVYKRVCAEYFTPLRIRVPESLRAANEKQTDVST